MSGVVLNTLVSGLIPAVLGALTMLVAHGLVGRRWKKDREERQWAEALAMARVVEDPDESDLAKLIAGQRLQSLGITPDWIAAEKHSKHAVARQLFGVPEPSIEEVRTIERAVSGPPLTIDPEIQAIVKVANYVEEMFAAARSDARAEEDVRVRIFLIAFTFAVVFMALAVTATLRVFS